MIRDLRVILTYIITGNRLRSSNIKELINIKAS